MELSSGLPLDRQRALYEELREAVALVPKRELRSWAESSARTLPRIIIRRTRNFLRVLGSLGRRAGMELVGVVTAYRAGDTRAHVSKRVRVGGRQAAKAARRLTSSVERVRYALVSNPRDNAPRIAISLLAFLAASGGADGDGGVPDLDLLGGIGAHRSIFTHSIFAPAVIEALLLSTATLVGLVYEYFPATHDPLWDAIAEHKDAYLAAAATGASLGITYHLFADSVFQPGTYHGLPGHQPLAVHQTIAGANAGMEAADVHLRRNEENS